ncbi:MAG TPA: reverse transcriptase family protein, partial [Planctomycetaceae bacterium]
ALGGTFLRAGPMGLLRWLLSLFSGARPAAAVRTATTPREKRRWARARLGKIERPVRRTTERSNSRIVSEPPYRFARRAVGWPSLLGRRKTGYFDFSTDADRERLARLGLPVLATPDDVASLVGLPVGKVAWLTGRFYAGKRPPSVRQAHYVFHWRAKRTGGARLIESPKPLLREAQNRILREILDRVPPHPSAHGFTRDRSILTNARPHCGHAIVVKWDLTDFYASVRFNRVVAIFRSLGYSREAAIWLASLTTSAVPADLPLPEAGAHALTPYLSRHLPQGAPTSPALANLSAFSLDVRLSGLAKAFGGTYTRYADDLTISGDEAFARRLRNVIPLVELVIRNERFHVHPVKRKVLRRGQRQTVAGVVVNAKPNVRRDEYDRLKAILHNATKHGAASQNRSGRPDFAAHLRGRIAHVAMLNPHRGAKLLRMYEAIDFR